MIFIRHLIGFRPARSVHHAVRTIKMQLQDGNKQTNATAGRWVIEGDLASYFDTVHHRLLMKAVRKRISDQRFLSLLWKMTKAGCVDRGLFRASSEGVLNIKTSSLVQSLFERSVQHGCQTTRWRVRLRDVATCRY
jgi:Retron-type reverse transcriptase